MSPYPLPPVPNFRVARQEPGLVQLNWADYPIGVKQGHKILGFRVYRSDTKDQLGKRIADESLLGPDAASYDDTSPEAGPDRFYLVVAIEETGFGLSPFGQPPFGGLVFTGWGWLPYNSRPFSSPMRGWGEGPYNERPYGF